MSGNNLQMDKIWETIDQLWEEEVLFLKNLGSYKSTLGNEKGVQDFVASYFEEMGLTVDAFDPDPERLKQYDNFGTPEWDYENRPVVNGTWHGSRDGEGKSIILQGHVDVVSAEPEEMWTYPPFQPRVVDGKMYGRGICDMKAGVTAMIFAVKSLKKAGLTPGADIHLQSVIEEECTGNGALALLDKGYTADGALIPEPFSENRLNAQVGVLWMKVKVKGAGAHVERADKSHNPINKAIRLIQALEEYEKYINSRPKHEDFKDHPHPLNVNTGMIHGGDWPSNVPVECTFDARVGFYPGQKPEDIQKEVKEWILEAADKDEWMSEVKPEVTFYGFKAPGSIAPSDSPLVSTLEQAHEKVNGQQLGTMNMTGTTDMRAYEEFGIPTTCYGPAGEKMHAPDEYVDLESVKRVTKSIASFLVDWCKVEEDK